MVKIGVHSKGSPVVAYVVVALFLCIGLGVFVGGGVMFWKSLPGPHWQETEGRILTSTVRESRGSKGGTSYAPQVGYEYVVGGVLYTNDDIHYPPVVLQPSRQKAKVKAAEYPVGATVRVHFDSRKPQTAVLQPGISPGTLFMMGFGLVFMLFSAGWFVLFLRQLAPKRAASYRPHFKNYSTTSACPWVVQLSPGGVEIRASTAPAIHTAIAGMLLFWVVYPLVFGVFINRGGEIPFSLPLFFAVPVFGTLLGGLMLYLTAYRPAQKEKGISYLKVDFRARTVALPKYNVQVESGKDVFRLELWKSAATARIAN